jgi:deoxyribonuclease V
VEAQRELSGLTPEAWVPGEEPWAIGACFVCFGRGGSGPGSGGEPGWAGAAVLREGRVVDQVAVRGEAGAPYHPGLLALREGPLLEQAVRCLARRPDVLFVNATGRDHPRRAGLALHLGALLDMPTVGVTHRPLVATGEWPPEHRGARAPAFAGGEVVGYWVRTRARARPLLAHAAWRTDAETAATVVLAGAIRARTPEPLRTARRLARESRAAAATGS